MNNDNSSKGKIDIRYLVTSCSSFLSGSDMNLSVTKITDSSGIKLEFRSLRPECPSCRERNCGNLDLFPKNSLFLSKEEKSV
jgi:hypothetical protein